MNNLIGVFYSAHNFYVRIFNTTSVTKIFLKAYSLLIVLELSFY